MSSPTAGVSRLTPPADEAASELIAALECEAKDKGKMIADFLRAYHMHIADLGIGVEGIASYLRAQRKVLANLYFAVREPVPSPATVKGLVLRFVIDSRSEICPPVDRFVTRKREAHWEVGEYRSGEYRSHLLPPAGGFRPVAVPFGWMLLAAANAIPMNITGIVTLVESLFGGAPAPADAAGVFSGMPVTALLPKTHPVPPKNGPREPFAFVWGDKACDFSGAILQHRLVVALWDASTGCPHASRNLSDVMGEVYGDDDECDDAFKNLCREVRKRFARAGIGLSVQSAGGKVWLQPLDD